MRSAFLGAAAASSLALSVACSNNNYSYAAVTNQKGDPAATIDLATGGEVTLPEGSAVEATVVLMSNSGNVLQGNIVSDNTEVLQVLPVMDASAYVFMGVGAGSAEVQIVVGGKDVQTVAATVAAPPASSMPKTIDAGLPGPPDAKPDA